MGRRDWYLALEMRSGHGLMGDSMVYRLNCNRTAQLHRTAGAAKWHHRPSLLHTHTHEAVLKSQHTICSKSFLSVLVNVATPVVSGGNDKCGFFFYNDGPTIQFKKTCIITGGSKHCHVTNTAEEKQLLCLFEA